MLTDVLYAVFIVFPVVETEHYRVQPDVGKNNKMIFTFSFVLHEHHTLHLCEQFVTHHKL